ncbi:MAG TPA: hypothetical protein VKS20_10470 [Candidatus Acidoferrales bacterium]|nr:hypothetical protein [Candidatus Acidoferrales bacterium]
MKSILITGGIIILSACAACSFKYFSDEAVWQNAQDALIRLHSGMQYESILMVRSRLADADAAVEDYASHWRIFPLDHTRRVQDARKGISYLSGALDWSSKVDSEAGSDTNQADALALAAYPDVTSSIPRWCEDGQLAFDPRVAVADFGIYGNYWLELAEGKEDRQPIGSEPPLNPTRELQQCREQQVARVKAQNAAIKARLDALRARTAAAEAEQRAQDAAAKDKEAAFLAAHPFQVQFSSYYGCSFVLYIDGEATGSKISLPGPPVSFRMAHSMTLEDARCGFKHVPADEILVRVNGSWYSPKWVQETAGRPGDPPSFKATLLPQLKSPK